MINRFYSNLINKLLSYLNLEEIIILNKVSENISENIRLIENRKLLKNKIKREYPKIVNIKNPIILLHLLLNNRILCLKCGRKLDFDYVTTLIVYMQNNKDYDLHNYHVECINPLTKKKNKSLRDILLYKCPLTNEIVTGWKCKYI